MTLCLDGIFAGGFNPRPVSTSKFILSNIITFCAVESYKTLYHSFDVASKVSMIQTINRVTYTTINASKKRLTVLCDRSMTLLRKMLLFLIEMISILKQNPKQGVSADF